MATVCVDLCFDVTTVKSGGTAVPAACGGCVIVDLISILIFIIAYSMRSGTLL